MSYSVFDKNKELSSFYEPNSACMSFAMTNNINESKEREKFIMYYRAKGQGSSNWDIVYLAWLKRCLLYAANFNKSKNKESGGSSEIKSAYEELFKEDPSLEGDSSLNKSLVNYYVHPDYRYLELNAHNHPIWPSGPEINPHSKGFDKKLFNARRLYLLTIPDGKEFGLDRMDLYDRSRYIYEITLGEETRHYQPNLAMLAAIII